MAPEISIEAKIFGAENRMRQGQVWFRRFDILGWEDVLEFIGACIRNEDDQLNLQNYVRDAMKEGLSKPSMLPDIKDKLWRCFRASFETDSISAMAAIVVPHESTGKFSWKVLETDPLTANLTEGQFIRISGPPGAGKTNLACSMIERWVTRGFIALTNIRGIPIARYTPNIRSFFRAVIDARRMGIPWCFWLDEPRIAGYIRSKTMTHRSQDLDQVVTAVRKMGGNMGLIEQIPEAVPKLIVAWARNLFYCHEPGNVSIDLRGPVLEWRQDVVDFPETTLPYDTRDFAAFRVDLNVDAMFQAIAGADDQLQAVLDYIDKPLEVRVRKPNPRDLPRGPKGEFAPSAI